MLSTARSKGLERAIASAPTAPIPEFLLPGFPVRSSRSFSASTCRTSQIGRAPLSIPPEVNFNILPPPVRKNGRASPLATRPTVEIEGPLGKMSMTIAPFVKIDYDTAQRKAYVSVEDREFKKQREMWGTTRAYLHNHILGVSEGHTAILRLVGVGYRATVENTATTVEPEFEGQKFVVLKVGYSHPIEMPIPQGVKASTPQPTRILLEGCEKEVLLQFAAKIRMWRKPEPYKGKGIFVNGETIKLKAKKIK
ncbi:ribosomal protein-like protein L6 [Mollisia scopiformis]|uniref:Large ribosomal subunit protein uL6m n=1 Tax=Mollisia scopiformis TaxID=149040 RepID=A0A194XSA9_MOLSC|nr:ribosomal protein-like protein L6 [Mollisia scopiformis]KUJ23083.1 ribosomal protein-like protein L6 [Mollisia scopiformis]